MSRRLSLACRPALLYVAAVAAALVVPGCSLVTSSDGRLAPTDLDATRAQRIWADPWVAPDEPALPGPFLGHGGWVDRTAGRRTTAYPTLDPLAAGRLEVDAAVARGWSLGGVDCGAGAGPDEPAVLALLTRGGDGAAGVDGSARAEVEVSTGADGGAEVVVTAVVPHHLDGRWPTPPAATDVAATCLAGGPAADVPDLESSGEPYDGAARAGGDSTGDDAGDVTWSRDRPTAAEVALRDAVDANSWVGDGVSPYDLGEDDAKRFGPGRDDELPGDVPAAVGRAVAAGWRLTWAACAPDGPVEATLALVSDDGVATARVTSTVDGTVARSVQLPVPEGPAPDWVADVPVLDDPACLRPAPLPEGRTAEGIPTWLPSSSQPFRD